MHNYCILDIKVKPPTLRGTVYSVKEAKKADNDSTCLELEMRSVEHGI